MRFCRLCGAESLRLLSTLETGEQWHHCEGCGSDTSDAVYTLRMPEEYPNRLECVPGPIRFLVELHAATAMGQGVRLETVPIGTPPRAGIHQIFGPDFLEQTLRDIGFRITTRPKAQADPQVWHLQKADGL